MNLSSIHCILVHLVLLFGVNVVLSHRKLRPGITQPSKINYNTNNSNNLKGENNSRVINEFSDSTYESSDQRNIPPRIPPKRRPATINYDPRYRFKKIEETERRYTTPFPKISQQEEKVTTLKEPEKKLIVLDINKMYDYYGYKISYDTNKVIFRANESYLFCLVKKGNEIGWRPKKEGEYPYKVIYSQIKGEDWLKVFFPKPTDTPKHPPVEVVTTQRPTYDRFKNIEYTHTQKSIHKAEMQVPQTHTDTEVNTQKSHDSTHKPSVSERLFGHTQTQKYDKHKETQREKQKDQYTHGHTDRFINTHEDQYTNKFTETHMDVHTDKSTDIEHTHIDEFIKHNQESEIKPQSKVKQLIQKHKESEQKSEPFSKYDLYMPLFENVEILDKLDEEQEQRPTKITIIRPVPEESLETTQHVPVQKVAPGGPKPPPLLPDDLFTKSTEEAPKPRLIPIKKHETKHIEIDKKTTSIEVVSKPTPDSKPSSIIIPLEPESITVTTTEIPDTIIQPTPPVPEPVTTTPDQVPGVVPPTTVPETTPTPIVPIPPQPQVPPAPDQPQIPTPTHYQTQIPTPVPTQMPVPTSIQTQIPPTPPIPSSILITDSMDKSEPSTSTQVQKTESTPDTRPKRLKKTRKLGEEDRKRLSMLSEETARSSDLSSTESESITKEKKIIKPITSDIEDKNKKNIIKIEPTGIKKETKVIQTKNTVDKSTQFPEIETSSVYNEDISIVTSETINIFGKEQINKSTSTDDLIAPTTTENINVSGITQDDAQPSTSGETTRPASRKNKVNITQNENEIRIHNNETDNDEYEINIDPKLHDKVTITLANNSTVFVLDGTSHTVGYNQGSETGNIMTDGITVQRGIQVPTVVPAVPAVPTVVPAAPTTAVPAPVPTAVPTAPPTVPEAPEEGEPRTYTITADAIDRLRQPSGPPPPYIFPEVEQERRRESERFDRLLDRTLTLLAASNASNRPSSEPTQYIPTTRVHVEHNRFDPQPEDGHSSGENGSSERSPTRIARLADVRERSSQSGSDREHSPPPSEPEEPDNAVTQPPAAEDSEIVVTDSSPQSEQTETETITTPTTTTTTTTTEGESETTRGSVTITLEEDNEGESTEFTLDLNATTHDENIYTKTENATTKEETFEIKSNNKCTEVKLDDKTIWKKGEQNLSEPISIIYNKTDNKITIKNETTGLVYTLQNDNWNYSTTETYNQTSVTDKILKPKTTTPTTTIPLKKDTKTPDKTVETKITGVELDISKSEKTDKFEYEKKNKIKTFTPKKGFAFNRVIEKSGTCCSKKTKDIWDATSRNNYGNKVVFDETGKNKTVTIHFDENKKLTFEYKNNNWIKQINTETTTSKETTKTEPIKIQQKTTENINKTTGTKIAVK